MKENNKLQIIKWNIYVAKVPFTTDFSNNKNRPVIVLVKVGGDVIILPISSKITKKSKHDIEISLGQPSLIKVANIQSISQKDIINAYYSKKTLKILKADNILKELNQLIFKLLTFIRHTLSGEIRLLVRN